MKKRPKSTSERLGARAQDDEKGVGTTSARAPSRGTTTEGGPGRPRLWAAPKAEGNGGEEEGEEDKASWKKKKLLGTLLHTSNAPSLRSLPHAARLAGQ